MSRVGSLFCMLTCLAASGCGRVNFESVASDASLEGGQLPEGCTDGLINNGESATDCGGPCVPCSTGQRCNTPSDCDEGVCSNNTCQAPTCADQVRNGDESDVDCGGSCEAKCSQSQTCRSQSDCLQLTCEAGTCAAPSCTDGLLNGDETDIDCGGACPPCLEGKTCGEASDCASSTCLQNACVVATCANGQIDAGETDMDCGGTCGASCLEGQFCVDGGDCAQGVCSGDSCVAPSCTDGVTNQDESDIDCGGTCGAVCMVGQACSTDGDCESGTCSSGTCAEAGCRIQGQLYGTDAVNPNNPCEVCDPTRAINAWSPAASGSACDDGADCTTTSACDGAGQCVGTLEANTCYIENQCWVQGESNPDNAQEYCNVNIETTAWSSPSCTDGILNGDEVGPDCGGSCSACQSGYNLCTTDQDCIQSGWGYLSCCGTIYCRRYWTRYYCGGSYN